MTEEFPGNSQDNRPTSIEASNGAGPPEKIEREKPVLGKVIRRKKSFGRRVKETFLGGETDGVFSYLVKEVIVPAIQNIVIDVVTQGVERAFTGDSSPRTRSSSQSGPRRTHVSYDKSSSGPIRGGSSASRRLAGRSRSAVDIGEIVLSTKPEAIWVLEQLEAIIEQYGAASVANLNDVLEQSSDTEFTDHKFGWRDLDDADIRRDRQGQGWLLILPDVESLPR